MRVVQGGQRASGWRRLHHLLLLLLLLVVIAADLHVVPRRCTTVAGDGRGGRGGGRRGGRRGGGGRRGAGSRRRRVGVAGGGGGGWRWSHTHRRVDHLHIRAAARFVLLVAPLHTDARRGLPEWTSHPLGAAACLAVRWEARARRSLARGQPGLQSDRRCRRTSMGRRCRGGGGAGGAGGSGDVRGDGTRHGDRRSRAEEDGRR